VRPASRPVAALCVAQVLTMTGVFTFPALLPLLRAEWSLSNTESGWIAGVYFAGYAVAAPVLLTLTDRIDARGVYLGGALLAAATSAAFAVFAADFTSAFVLRGLAGVGLAATYMPGLRVLVDRYYGPRPWRAIALYTSSFSLGTAVSFFVAGSAASVWGWQAAFVVAAAAALAAVVIVRRLPPVRPMPPADAGRLRDMRAVLGNRTAVGYVLAYGVHCWELFTLRSWLVAFLACSLTLQPPAAGTSPAPTTVATVSGLVAMAASIAGNELAHRFGRRRVIGLIMLASAATAGLFGFAASLPYAAVVALALFYTAAVQLDSGALTAGAVAAATPGRQGSTMALYTLIGFGAGGVGPLVLGRVLDLTGGGTTARSWGLAFASVAIVGLAGPLALLAIGKARPARR
jgi:MFS family permease